MTETDRDRPSWIARPPSPGSRRAALVALALLVPSAAALADYQSGRRAFEAGDYAAARHDWETTARGGDSAAQIALGLLYENGYGVARDYARAVAWYQHAAEQGDAKGQYELGMKYLKGQGVARDADEALRWLRAAAEQGLPEAQYELGLFYRRGGGGTAPDPAAAARWHEKAARQGHALAMARLANMYRDGVGVATDPVEAHVWYSLAVENKVSAARPLKRLIEKDLSEAQKAEAADRLEKRRAEIAAGR